MPLNAPLSSPALPPQEQQLFAGHGVTVTDLRIISKGGTFLVKSIAGVEVVKGAATVVGAMQWIAIWAIAFSGIREDDPDRAIARSVLCLLIGGVGFFAAMKRVVRIYLPGGRAEVFSGYSEADAVTVRKAILGAMRPS